MLTKRIIPCLDIKDGRVVKGVSFVNLRDAGNPVELAEVYEKEGADELVLLDISATEEGRQTTVDVVRETAARVRIPFAVGGGIHSVRDMERLITAGAAKVSVNTAAVENPRLVEEGSRAFGRAPIVVAIDAKYEPEADDWYVYTRGGKQRTRLKVREWAQQVEDLGAGELLLTSIDQDGRKDGYDIPLIRRIATAVNIPVIASGGAGEAQHFVDVLTEGQADAALAASVFHFRELSIGDLKTRLRAEGVPVR